LHAEDLSDKDLLERFLAGDEAAFAALMRRHEDAIFALAHRITGNRADALEATQETFISLFRAAGTFGGRSQLYTWLYRIGINAARDALRRRRRAPIPEEEPELLEGPTWHAASVEEVASTRIDLSRALAALPDDYREAVVMHDLGGIPYEEIARATGVALGTVKSRISRGRRLLARGLEQHFPTPASKDTR